jgi:hypothetical protein
MTGMTKRALRIVPPHCRSAWIVLPPLLVNLNHLYCLDVSCPVPDTPREANDAAGKAMQRKTHPDAGGSDAEFQEVQEAIEEVLARP